MLQPDAVAGSCSLLVRRMLRGTESGNLGGGGIIGSPSRVTVKGWIVRMESRSVVVNHPCSPKLVMRLPWCARHRAGAGRSAADVPRPSRARASRDAILRRRWAVRLVAG